MTPLQGNTTIKLLEKVNEIREGFDQAPLPNECSEALVEMYTMLVQSSFASVMAARAGEGLLSDLHTNTDKLADAAERAALVMLENWADSVFTFKSDS